MVKLFLIVLILLVTGRICKPKGSLLTLRETKKCLRKIPFDVNSSEIKDVIPRILNILKNYPYIDSYKNPPLENIPGFDLEEDLKNIEKRLTSDGGDKISNALDFYQEIIKVLKKTKDCHVQFTPPFLNKFKFVLPYLILQKSVDDEIFFYLQKSYFFEEYRKDFEVLLLFL
jgi:hypothetical protein